MSIVPVRATNKGSIGSTQHANGIFHLKMYAIQVLPTYMFPHSPLVAHFCNANEMEIRMLLISSIIHYIIQYHKHVVNKI